jgi:rod shape-determining protein MreD
MHRSSKIVHIIPVFLIVVLVIFEGSYNSLLYFGKYTPFYELLIIFYWAIFLPRSVPVIMLILVGVFRDFLLINPIGISSISFVFLKFLVNQQEVLVKDRSFPTVFMLFVISILIICILNILILMFLSDTPIIFLMKLFSFRISATLGLYIPMHFAFNFIRERMLSKDDAQI